MIVGMCQLKRLVELGDWVEKSCILTSKFQCNIYQCLNLPLTCVHAECEFILYSS